MSTVFVTNEVCCNFKELICKCLQTKSLWWPRTKLLKYFVWQTTSASFFDAMTAQYTLKPNGKRKYHRNSTMSNAEVMLIMILFHDSCCCCFIETVNDELKNIAQVECSRYRCFDNFIVNSLGAIAAYCLSPKKLCINVQRTIETQLTLFWIRRIHA